METFLLPPFIYTLLLGYYLEKGNSSAIPDAKDKMMRFTFRYSCIKISMSPNQWIASTVDGESGIVACLERINATFKFIDISIVLVFPLNIYKRRILYIG